MDAPGRHPHRNSLSAFALGRLDDDESTAIETHLQACEQCCASLSQIDDATDPFLSRLRDITPSDGAPVDVERVHGTAHGMPRVAGYEILGELGRGGMGVVYQARQTRLNRVVALKMLLSGVHAGPETLVRFRAEAEAVARLRHANVVQIYEIGDHDGMPYLAFEYLPGGCLADLAGGASLTPRDAAVLVEAIARGIAAAHRAGVIHRDLKPANVLLTAERVPKVTDFGLAKMADGDLALTRTGTLAGTPAYMAPEQANGQVHAIGPATDIYGLGAILYEVLTGRPPFRGSTSLETIKRVCSDPPVPPRRARPGLPRDLETVCLKCLRKEPHRRYASADALADDLGRFLEGRPVAARPVGRLEAVWRAARRRPELAALVVVVLLLAAVGFPLVTVLWLETAQSRGEAQTRAAEATAERNVSRRQLADLYLDRGLDLARSGDVGTGVHWMLEALRTSPEGDADFQGVARLNLADWSRFAVRPVYYHPLRQIRSVDFSPDGRTYALGDFYATVRFFETASGRQLGPTIDIGEKNVCSLAYSPDGTRIVTGCAYHFNFEARPHAARIFDVATGALVGKPLWHPNLAESVGWSPDGKQVVTGGSDHQIRIWDAATGNLIGTPIDNGEGVISAVTFAHGGTRLLAYSSGASDGPALRVWDVARRTTVGRPFSFGHGNKAEAGFAFAPNCETAIAPRAEGGVAIHRFDLTTGERLQETTQLTSVQVPALSPDGLGMAAITSGSRLVVGRFGPRSFRGAAAWHPSDEPSMAIAVSPDGHTVLASRGVWRIPATVSGPVRRPADVLDGPRPKNPPVFQHAAFSPDATRVLFGHGPLGAVASGILCETATGRPLAAPQIPVGISAFSPDGRQIAVAKSGWGDRDYAVRIWDYANSQAIGRRLEDHNNVLALVFSSDGRTLATGGLYGGVYRWDLADGQPLGPMIRAGGPITKDGLSLSSDGRLLATGSYEVNQGRVWDVVTGRPLGPVVAGVQGVCFDASGRKVLGWTHAAARVWDSTMTRPLTPPFGQGSTISLAAFSPDGGTVILAGRDGVARLWSATTGEPVGREMRGSEEPSGLAFSPDGRSVVIGHEDGTAHLWDTATGWPAGAPVAQPHAILALAWAPDGRSFFTASAAGSVRRWPVPVGTEADPERLATTLEHLTGTRMAPGRVVSPILPEEWSRLQFRVDEQSVDRTLPPDEPFDVVDDARARDAEDAGDGATALWFLDRLVAVRPDDWWVHCRRGHVLLITGDLVGATAAYRAAEACGAGAALEWWYQALVVKNGGKSEWAQWYRDRLAAIAHSRN